MNIKKFLDKHPLPWEVERQDMSCDGYYDAVLDCNGSQVCLEEIVEIINSEFQPLNTKDLPGQSTLEYMCWQEGILLNIGSGTPHEYNTLPNPDSAVLLPLSTGGGYAQHKPELVENVVNDYKTKIDLINDLRGIMTLDEARTKIFGWEPLKGERGDQLLE